VERDAALADFGEARREWEEAFARVPDDALRYLKPGDDYSLGGLQIHVNWVLARYLRVLESGTVAQPPPSAAGLRDGLSPAERRQSLAEMSRLHEAVKTRVDRLAKSDWSRKSPVDQPGRRRRLVVRPLPRARGPERGPGRGVEDL